jgi:Zn-dependent protease
MPLVDITKLAARLVGTGRIEITFDILEPEDGLALDILYAAARPSTFKIEGVIEGVKSFSPYETQITGDVALKTAWQLLKILAAIALFLGVLFIVIWLLDRVINKIPKNRYTEFIGKFIPIAFFLGVFILLAAGAIQNARKTAIGTPQTFIPPALAK